MARTSLLETRASSHAHCRRDCVPEGRCDGIPTTVTVSAVSRLCRNKRRDAETRGREAGDMFIREYKEALVLIGFRNDWFALDHQFRSRHSRETRSIVFHSISLARFRRRGRKLGRRFPRQLRDFYQTSRSNDGVAKINCWLVGSRRAVSQSSFKSAAACVFAHPLSFVLFIPSHLGVTQASSPVSTIRPRNVNEGSSACVCSHP